MRVLIDKLEEKMKGSAVDGVIKRLFAGQVRSFIKCLNVQYESNREEEFYDIQLDVKGCKNIYDSFRRYIAKEVLDGDNKYDAGDEYGKQDAEKGVVFTSFPPVLTIHLKRFDFDIQRMGFAKIHDRFEFPHRLELDEFLAANAAPESPSTANESPSTANESHSTANESPSTANESHSTANSYILHSVLVHEGGVNGGHYYAYIRPATDTSSTNSQQQQPRCGSTHSTHLSEHDTQWSHAHWFEFNDEIVRCSTATEAIERCFGRESNPHTPYVLEAKVKLNNFI